MSLYDKEKKIIEYFQGLKPEEILLLGNEKELEKILLTIYNQENWEKWIDSSAKNQLPPDFFNEREKIMMEVMRIDDHERINSNGKPVNPTLQKENELYHEITSKLPFFDYSTVNLHIIADSGLDGEEDHNYKYYKRGFSRIVEKHGKQIGSYVNNHKKYKLIFFIFDESSAYVRKGITTVENKIIGTHIHNWFLDKNFLEIFKNYNVDYLIWFAPYKHYIGLNNNAIPAAVVYDLKNIDNNILIRYDENEMKSVEK